MIFPAVAASAGCACPIFAAFVSDSAAIDSRRPHVKTGSRGWLS
jgi:hypothetical protein